MRVKLRDLKIGDLDVILRAPDLQVKGNKTAKNNELMTKLESDEIETDDYDIMEQNASTGIQAQINELKEMVANLATTVQTACLQQQSQAQGTVEQETTRLRQTLDGSRHTHAPSGMQPENVLSSPQLEAQGQGFTSIKEMIGILPDFDPIKGSITSEQFIAKCSIRSVE
ncbi:GD22243 [Drosophila simulans]|uniref:GD22243 n=1 Tax=Drosophila simulans TaxID=7240 RepID=B4NVY9_DROSI|nr:GD22243 [Drosophila simulans]